MLLELAIGDAYGACFEYVPAKAVRSRNLLIAGYQGGLRRNHVAGRYTDDTQQAPAIAECVLSGESWTPTTVAKYLVKAFARDPRQGYSKRMYQLLNEVAKPLEPLPVSPSETQLSRLANDFLRKIKPSRPSSGGAMRSSPIGVIESLDEVKSHSRTQAELTHIDTGIDAAIASALMTHYFIYDLGPKSRLPEFVAQHVPLQWQIPWRSSVGSGGVESVAAAITAIVLEGSLAAILKRCVNFTGDVDTVAAIALATASCSSEVECDLPKHLHTDLENGNFGRDYISNVDAALMNRAYRN